MANTYNEYSNGSGTISFDIDEQHNIVNFTFSVDVYGNRCSGTIDTISVNNSTFSFIMDEVVKFNNQLFMGSIEGRFSHEKMDGTINIQVCGISAFADNTRDMSAFL